MAQPKDVRLVTEAKLDVSNTGLKAGVAADLAPIKNDVADLKVLGGLNPGSVNDTTSANLIETPGTQTHSALSAAIDDQVATPGTAANDAITGAVVSQEDRPAYAPASAAASFDPVRSVYNLSPAALRKYRAAYGKALSQTGQLHINVSGSSTPAGAGAGAMPYKHSWPAILKRRLAAVLGDGGTGLVHLWDNMGIAGIPASDDRIKFSGTIESRTFGVFQRSAKSIYGGGSFMEFTPEMPVDEFWVYGIAGSVAANVFVDGVSVGAIGMTSAGGGTFPPEPGYFWNTALGGGQRVHRIPVTMGTHTLRIESQGTSANRVTILAVEGRVAGKGVRVTSSALSGMSAYTQRYDDTSTGYFGLPVSSDMVRADLSIVQIGTNDWQAHESIANFKNNYGLFAQRAKTQTTAPHGPTAQSDLMFIAGQPLNHATLPAGDPGNDSPALALYQAAIWEMADQYDARVLDLNHRWESFEISGPLGYYADDLHATALGHGDIATAVMNAL